MSRGRAIYLVRHGQAQSQDDPRRYIGQTDLPLSEEGRRQARELRVRFERADIGAVISSDLVRSRETAESIAAGVGVPVVARRDLREIDLGQWEGCTFQDIAARFPEAFVARGKDIGGYRVPGGESFSDCGNRVVPALQSILHGSSGNVVIVAHAGVNRLLLCHVLGMPVANLFRIGQDCGCVNLIRQDGDALEVTLVNGRGAVG